MTKQEKVAAFMLENKFEWLEEDQQWYKVLPHKAGDFQGKGRGQYMHPELATFFYDVTYRAEKRGYNTGFQKASRINKRDSVVAIQLREIADKIDEDVRHLKQEGKTNE